MSDASEVHRLLQRQGALALISLPVLSRVTCCKHLQPQHTVHSNLHNLLSSLQANQCQATIAGGGTARTSQLPIAKSCSRPLVALLGRAAISPMLAAADYD